MRFVSRHTYSQVAQSRRTGIERYLRRWIDIESEIPDLPWSLQAVSQEVVRTLGPGGESWFEINGSFLVRLSDQAVERLRDNSYPPVFEQAHHHSLQLFLRFGTASRSWVAMEGRLCMWVPEPTLTLSMQPTGPHGFSLEHRPQGRGLGLGTAQGPDGWLGSLPERGRQGAERALAEIEIRRPDLLTYDHRLVDSPDADALRYILHSIGGARASGRPSRQWEPGPPLTPPPDHQIVAWSRLARFNEQLAPEEYRHWRRNGCGRRTEGADGVSDDMAFSL